jgi:chromosome segregation ATPase
VGEAAAGVVSDLGELLAVAEPGDGVPLGQYARAVVAAKDLRGDLDRLSAVVDDLHADLANAQRDRDEEAAEAERLFGVAARAMRERDDARTEVLALRAELASALAELETLRREKETP